MPLFHRNTLIPLLLSASAFTQAAELESVEQRFSYVLGYQFAQQIRSEGIQVDVAAFTAAIEDVLKSQPLQLSMDEMRAALQSGRQAVIEKKQAEAQAALEAGKAFLEQNKNTAGVVVLPSGLQYIELKAGEGDSPGTDAEVTVHYRGTLIDGREFDSSYTRGEAVSFALNGVIPGFRESLMLMKPGAKWKVFVPPELGYGDKGAGSSIGPNQTLIFEIELLSVK
ncbi:MAG: FKBP-type peptidyl-prolyl cis-trans isomerase [Gammaproteobacteria bacterium]|nr:FKBP-type peptidyl-prolyl cis-trans isomerase [Gammaproteobacteria bacterium]MCP5417911.1 FKBP-type peptidyl-prolyl cis-trans isomerase [Chromatiaceae bacterium]